MTESVDANDHVIIGSVSYDCMYKMATYIELVLFGTIWSQI